MAIISVITPSIRPEFLNITQETLEAQTFQDFEWIVEIGLRNRGYTLPSDQNKLVKRAKGSIIVILQDCITIPSDFLEKVSKMDFNMKAYTFPIGKVKVFGENPVSDWREHTSGKINGHYWEIDLGAASKDLFYEVGGFDEEFNKGWSWENTDLGNRAEKAGYEFYCDNSLLGVALDHDALKPNPFRNKRENNDSRYNENARRAESGDFRKPFLVPAIDMPIGDMLDRYSILLLKRERLPSNEETEAEIRSYEEVLTPYWKQKSTGLKQANGDIWTLESDIRKGKDGELGLEEIGRRTILIRDNNKIRVGLKNDINRQFGFSGDIKGNHASQ